MESKAIATQDRSKSFRSRSRSRRCVGHKRKPLKIEMNFDFSDEDETETNWEVKDATGKTKFHSRTVDVKIGDDTKTLDPSPVAGSSFDHPRDLSLLDQDIIPDAESTRYSYLTGNENVTQNFCNFTATSTKDDYCSKSKEEHFLNDDSASRFIDMNDNPLNCNSHVNDDARVTGWKDKDQSGTGIVEDFEKSSSLVLGNSDKNSSSSSPNKETCAISVLSCIKDETNTSFFPIQYSAKFDENQERIIEAESEGSQLMAREKLKSLPDEQGSKTKSSLISALFHSNSLQNLSSEILASSSDDEKITSVPSKQMGNFDHACVSASCSDSDTETCNEHSGDFNKLYSQDNLTNKKGILNYDSIHNESVKIQDSTAESVVSFDNDKKNFFLSPSERPDFNSDNEHPEENGETCYFSKIKSQLKFDSSDSQSMSLHTMCSNNSLKWRDKQNEDGADSSCSEDSEGKQPVVLKKNRCENNVSGSFQGHESSPEKEKFYMRTIVLPEERGTTLGDQTCAQMNESDSCSDDDNFENFVSQVKKDIQIVAEKERSRKELLPLDDFIVEDDDSEDSLSGCDSENEYDSDSDEDDALFYIKVTNKFERDEARLSFGSGSESHEGKLNSGEGWRKNSSFSDDSCFTSSSLSEPSLTIEKTEAPPKERSEGRDAKNFKDVLKNIQVNDKRKKVRVGTLSENFKPNYVPFLNKTTISSHVPSSFNLDESVQERIKENLATPVGPKCKGAISKHCTNPASGVQGDKNNFRTPDVRIRQRAGAAHLMTAPRPMLPSPEDRNKSFFLKSLSLNCADWKRHPEAQRFYKNFNSLKAELTSKLFRIFNDTVFDTKIPETISLEWSPRYTKTAGTFSFRQRGSIAKITLSQKVCDNPERVRDTLAHELCHAAVKLINGVNESHGPFWKSWAMKVNRTFPFLPVVARCHDYTINTKYTYQCVNCKYRVGRHSKSLDTDRKVCGHCNGSFELFLTKDLNSTKGSESYTPRTPNKFASYVKEHYSERKKGNEGMKHGDVMRLLSKEFAAKNKISDDL